MLRTIVGSLPFCALALASTNARAQTAVYVEGGLANYGFTNLNNNSGTSFKGDTGNLGGGLFYNFPIQSRVTVGVDAHALYSPGSKGGTMCSGALRVGFVPHHNPLRPYVQIGGGIVHSSYQETYSSVDDFNSASYTVSRGVTRGAIELAFGLDIRLTEHLDLRAPEYGAEAGGGHGVSAGAAFLNVGLVYHLRPKSQT